MKESLRSYIQTRANQQGLSLSEVCLRANISRQTLYSLHQVPEKLPALKTIVSLASVLGVHPIKLLKLIFDDLPLGPQVKRSTAKYDKSAFIQETIPDGTLVLFGQRFTKTWEVQNVGRVAWENRYLQCMDESISVYTNAGVRLPIADNLVPEHTRIPVPYTEPGAIVQLTVNFTAPNSPGTFISYWKSVFEDGSLCLPKAQGLSVRVRVSSLT